MFYIVTTNGHYAARCADIRFVCVRCYHFSSVGIWLVQSWFAAVDSAVSEAKRDNSSLYNIIRKCQITGTADVPFLSRLPFFRIAADLYL